MVVHLVRPWRKGGQLDEGDRAEAGILQRSQSHCASPDSSSSFMWSCRFMYLCLSFGWDGFCHPLASLQFTNTEHVGTSRTLDYSKHQQAVHVKYLLSVSFFATRQRKTNWWQLVYTENMHPFLFFWRNLRKTNWSMNWYGPRLASSCDPAGDMPHFGISRYNQFLNKFTELCWREN
jgi:hypothetical protein